MDDDAMPAAVRLVRDFVNTREPQVDGEDLTGERQLGRWLTEHDLLADAGAVTARDLTTALHLREGLRAVLLGHAGHDVDPGALQTLNQALAEVPVRLAFDAAGEVRITGAAPGSAAAALAALLDSVRQAREDGSWARLKVCARDSCRWAFYDASRNQVRRWCSMAGCGNHVKMQRAYQSRKARQTPVAGT